MYCAPASHALRPPLSRRYHSLFGESCRMTIPLAAKRAAFMVCLLGVAAHVPAQEAPAQDASNVAAALNVPAATLLDVFYNARAFVDESQGAPPDAPRLGLSEVVQRAIENSGRLKAADELVIQREAQTEQARSARRPSLGGQIQVAYLGGFKQELPSSPIADLIIDTDSFSLGDHLAIGAVSAQQVIYAGGRITATIRAARSATAAEEFQRLSTLNEITRESIEAYYRALLARALVRVANESANTFQSHLADAEKALEVGAVSRFEVIRAQTELKSREADLARALTADDVATLNLRRLTGIEGDGPLYLEPDWFTAALPTEDLNAIVAEALQNRPELNALDKGLDAAQQQVKIRQAGRKPTVGALAQYQHIEGGTDIIPEGFLATGILRWDFYTGGRVRNEIIEARSQVRELEFRRHDVEQAVKLDVRQAWQRANEAAQRILMQFATVQLAEQGQELAELRFQQGAGTQTETLDADLALVTARTGLVQALGDYFLAQADLAKATGRGWQPGHVGAPLVDEAADATAAE